MAETPTYDLKNGKPQPFHLVRPSVWPLIGALAAGVLTSGTVMFMHHIELLGIPVHLWGVFFGFAGILSVMWFWWKDVVKEAFVEKAHSPIVKIGFRYGMALFISSEVMFFVAFFWAFFAASLFPKEAIGFVWPPANVHAIHPFELPFLMTMILLLSGCTVTWAHHAIIDGKQDEATRALFITVLLGIAFTCFQAFEYYHATFRFSSANGGNIYSSAFYMATGFHGFHVLVGTIFLIVCLFRNMKGHFTSTSHFGFEAAAWYWHFVDVVWLFLFTAIYWWGNGLGH